ncbi:MAG: sigma factor-like helix-turn-helix DNA-binding protein [bacterium]
MPKTILETIIEEKEKKDALGIEPHSLVLDLFKELNENERDILTRRFGLLRQKCETLEQVGREKGVTRERIRQIEKGSIKKLQQIYLEEEKLKSLKNIVVRILEEYGGLMRENHLLDVLLEYMGSVEKKESNKQAIVFMLANLFDEPNLLKNHPDFHNSWYLSQVHVEKAREIISLIEKKIIERNELLDELGLTDVFNEIEIERKPFDAYLNATKKIEQNNFGHWGIASWATVTPKRINDKAYLIFKKMNKPLHFREVADLINESAFGDKKIANAGTVHNELIMDPRYVLIGRGIYALKEWGFTPGTVSDLVFELLKKSGPMHRDEIVEKVSKQRMVSENTIKVSLIDKNLFKKAAKNVYGIADGVQD